MPVLSSETVNYITSSQSFISEANQRRVQLVYTRVTADGISSEHVSASGGTLSRSQLSGWQHSLSHVRDVRAPSSIFNTSTLSNNSDITILRSDRQALLARSCPAILSTFYW